MLRKILLVLSIFRIFGIYHRIRRQGRSHVRFRMQLDEHFIFRSEAHVSAVCIGSLYKGPCFVCCVASSSWVRAYNRSRCSFSSISMLILLVRYSSRVNRSPQRNPI